ncbi:MAG: hypothetical protein PHW36_00820 [Bacilli bacterium]|nr:hypothetical protein [Bacilli bacterium]
MLDKLKSTWSHRHELKASVQEKGLKQTVLNESGAVNMTLLGAEAIGILILVVIWTIIPYIGSTLTEAIPAINESSAWYGVSDGASLWIQAEPMLRICVIVVIVGLVLSVVLTLRKGKQN